MSDLYELKGRGPRGKRKYGASPSSRRRPSRDTDRTLTGADARDGRRGNGRGLASTRSALIAAGDLTHARALADEFLRWASVPVFMEPNAGIPVVEGRQDRVQGRPGGIRRRPRIRRAARASGSLAAAGGTTPPAYRGHDRAHRAAQASANRRQGGSRSFPPGARRSPSARAAGSGLARVSRDRARHHRREDQPNRQEKIPRGDSRERYRLRPRRGKGPNSTRARTSSTSTWDSPA